MQLNTNVELSQAWLLNEKKKPRLCINSSLETEILTYHPSFIKPFPENMPINHSITHEVNDHG